MTSIVRKQCALRQKLPDAPWREAVSSLGYSVGFLMVILGRMQLFTEQTIVTVLPVMAEPSRPRLWATARLWIIAPKSAPRATMVWGRQGWSEPAHGD